MIIYSDNRANDLVLFALGDKYISKSDLILGLPTTYLSENFITVSIFAALFKRLYDASYLTRQNSEASLRLLSQTDFSYGIVAGVPKKVVVSHKFGERENKDGIQLHDCGIVYAPDDPYILCIMTKGNDVHVLMHIIQDLSKIFYTNITSPILLPKSHY